ncbi:Maf family protein [Stenotrophomonas tumulicola]|uniref:7-methyl-GTP pyrophosphatase n=1 Tax=Stenotrophomonas tumulicola TaxID=1685415 RepID=A0A7W3FLV6_9GAMM|nr:Maf family nucleotide pyrophosphatase [Stenotrophomonas tumulicola]MBA8681963.1 septum formation inhibitor Maf [Stenotrophomonas tumulicola]
MSALLLASTSPYRRELLQRLRLPFDCARPAVDETPLPGEAPAALAARLAAAKATEVAARHPGRWVIGSDQAADLEGQPLGKPGSIESACAQLALMSGRAVRFHTAICLTRDGDRFDANDVTTVRFRALATAEIARYVAAEQPLDCAGSFKCEGLGIALFDAIENQDPTALVGLPLIALCRLLRQAGFAVP